jgi:hypothetical protein
MVVTPPSSAWLAAEELRKRIQGLRERIRKLRRMRRDALRYGPHLEPPYAADGPYVTAIDEAISDAMDWLERLRRDCQALGEPTNEECDEPLDDPPPPPNPRATETFIVPAGSFINRDTGEMQILPLNPPPQEPWVAYGLQPPDFRPNAHWGWRLSRDEDGHCTWSAGWIIDD